VATFIEAVRKYGPRLNLSSTIPLPKLARWISTRTSLNESEVMMVLIELKEAILHFNGLGIPVKLPGLGRFRPSISVDGEYRIHLRLDSELRESINQRDAYTGRVENRGNIGLTREEFKAIWDAEHPDDPLEL
jgi:hypothetical protein